jgi:hypothetical protein
MTESTAKPAPDPHPQDPIGSNPAPEGHPAHKIWEDATQEALEEVFRLNARMLGSQPGPEGIANWSIELSFRKYQIWAKRNLCIVRRDQDARAYEQWLDDYMQAWIDSSGGRFPDVMPELKAQLLRACNYWKGNAWAQFRALKRHKASPLEESKGLSTGMAGDANNSKQQDAISAPRTPTVGEQPPKAAEGGGPRPPEPMGGAGSFRFANARPLGDNRFPSDHPAHEAFEKATWRAKQSINQLQSELPDPQSMTSTEAIRAALKFRMDCVSICASEALLIVGDEHTAHDYEHLVDDLLEFHLTDILSKSTLTNPENGSAGPLLLSAEDMKRLEGELRYELLRLAAAYKGKAASRVLLIMELEERALTQSQRDRIATLEAALREALAAHEMMREIVDPGEWLPASRPSNSPTVASEIVKLEWDLVKCGIDILKVLAEASLSLGSEERFRVRLEHDAEQVLRWVLAQVNEKDLSILDKSKIRNALSSEVLVWIAKARREFPPPWDPGAPAPVPPTPRTRPAKAKTDAKVPPAVISPVAEAQKPKRKGDIALLKKADGTLYQSVDFPTAETYAGITPRRRQQLMSDVLKTVGNGQNRRITVESSVAYCPPAEDAN